MAAATQSLSRRLRNAVRCTVSCRGANSATCAIPCASIAGTTHHVPSASQTSAMPQPIAPRCPASCASPRASEPAQSAFTSAGATM